MDLELIGSIAVIVGLLLVFAGYIWLMVRGWKTHWLWGLGLLVPPVALLFLFFQFRRAIAPVGVICLGLVIGVTLPVLTLLGVLAPDLGPYQTTDEKGNVIIILTGWDRTDYSVLKQSPKAIKVVMSNADVTDATLAYIKHMDGLEVLELDNANITDEGLATIGTFKNLKTLKLRNNKQISDAAFREHIVPLPALRIIDVVGTPVTLETQQAWKKAGKGRRFAPAPK